MPDLADDYYQTEGPLAALEGPGKTKEAFYFPGDLAEIDHWCAFRIGKYAYDNVATSELENSIIEKKDTIATIFLPYPSNIQTGYNANYNNEDIGVAGRLGASVGGDIFDGLTKVGSGDVEGAKAVGQKLIDKIKASYNSGDMKGGLASLGASVLQSDVAPLLGAGLGSTILSSFPILGGIGGAVGGQIARQATQGAFAGQGIAINPHTASIFTGTNFRVHRFSYKFIPKNLRETKELRSIIHKFKYHMLPGYKSGFGNHFFEYPEQFDIDFQYPEYLFNIGRSVLTDFNVNYQGENGPHYFDIPDENTKAPVSVILDMSFTEVSITTKDQVNRTQTTLIKGPR